MKERKISIAATVNVISVTRRFQKKESVGTCPVCGGLVYEGKKNFYCGNRECNFCLWKENKYLQSMEKDMDARMGC